MDYFIFLFYLFIGLDFILFNIYVNSLFNNSFFKIVKKNLCFIDLVLFSFLNLKMIVI